MPPHPSSESTPAIQLQVPAPPVEHLAPVSPVVSPQPAAQAAPLQQQLARPMIRLASAENGAHTLVVRVAPDDLGPVTIQAHISDAGVKIELFAPNEAGREAIKQILPELRRDLTSTAADGSVSVSDQNAPSADSDERARQPRAAPQDGGSRTARDLPDVSTLSPLSGSSAYALDVLA
jgi:flagellar hook-length control protein FliK